MKTLTLHKQWIIEAPINEVFRIITDFENFPTYFPKVAESIHIIKSEGNHLEINANAITFGRQFPVKMVTEILPGKGFISDNDSRKFGTSGHEELLLYSHPQGTIIDYTYQVTIHKRWLSIFATPLIRWYAMRFWERAVIDRLKVILRK